MLACLEATIKLQSTNHHLYSPFQLCSLCNCTRTSWHVSIQVSFTWEDFSTVWTRCLPCVALHVVTQGSAVLESLATHRTMKWTGLFSGVVPISWLTPKSDYNKVMCISNIFPMMESQVCQFIPIPKGYIYKQFEGARWAAGVPLTLQMEAGEVPCRRRGPLRGAFLGLPPSIAPFHTPGKLFLRDEPPCDVSGCPGSWKSAGTRDMWPPPPPYSHSSLGQQWD